MIEMSLENRSLEVLVLVHVFVFVFVFVFASVFGFGFIFAKQVTGGPGAGEGAECLEADQL